MNITNINQKSSTTIDNKNGTTSSDMLPSLQKGQIIEGLISKVSDDISINFNDREVKASKSAVRDAREGEIRRFEIMDVSDTGIVLKEVGTGTEKESRKILCTNVETNQNAFKEYLEKMAENKDEDIEKSKEKLNDISSRMTKKDYDMLMKEGKTLEAYELIRLEMALERVKSQRQDREEGIQREAEKIENVSDQTQKAFEGSRRNSDIDKEIASKLEEADLPVTDEMIEKIKSALELSKTAVNMSDKSMSYMIKNNLEPTIKNIYKSQYSGGAEYNNKITEGQWEELQESVKDIIKNSGLEINQENMEAAKWIIENGIPLTEDTLQKMNNLKDIKENSNFEQNLNKIIDGVKDGKKPENTLLDNSMEQNMEESVKSFNDISDEQIIKASDNNKQINLEAVRQQEKTEKGSQLIISEDMLQNGEINIKAVTAKRQIEEIRLKLTVESGMKLMKQGINVNTEDLERIVEGLRELEDSYYKNFFSEAGKTADEKDIAILSGTLNKLNELKTVPEHLLGTTFQNRNIHTIESLHNEGIKLKASFDNAKESYETLMTSPRRDLGDSIEKAFRNVDDILKDLDLEITKGNQRAVRILGYNNMEISKESITQMKAYDAKVNDLIQNLHPAVVVDMIKDGVDTLNTPIDDLNKQVLDIRENLDLVEDEKYSKYLWKLDKNQEITPEERKAYIGIYRLLDKVEKSQGAAVGAVVNAGQEVNLNNLLTSVRTKKLNGINANVDDNFGTLEKLNNKSESITDQISYMNSLVRNIKDNISPQDVYNLKEEIYDMSLENVYENIAQEEDSTYASYRLDEIRKMSQESQKALEFIANFQMPETIENIAAASEYQKGNSVYKKIKNLSEDNLIGSEDVEELEHFTENLADNMTDYNETVKQFEKLEQKIGDILRQAEEKEVLTSNDLDELKALKGSIQLTTAMSRRESYEIPVIVDGRLTSINLTIINGSKENGKVSAAVESEQLGSFKAEFSVKGDSVKGCIICDSRKGLDSMKNVRQELESSFNDIGFNLNQIDYGIDHTINETYISKNTLEAKLKEEKNEVSNSQLYQISKVFVSSVSIAEKNISNI